MTALSARRISNACGTCSGVVKNFIRDTRGDVFIAARFGQSPLGIALEDFFCGLKGCFQITSLSHGIHQYSHRGGYEYTEFVITIPRLAEPV